VVFVLPRLSIVIPVANGVEFLEDTLVSVLENRPAACEVIVVHPCCYDDPYNLGGEVRFVETTRRGSCVQLANLGIAAARGDIVHLLACGALVEQGWTEPVLIHFDEPDVSCVTPLVVDPSDPSRIAAAGVGYGRGGRRVLIGRRRKWNDRFRPSKRLVGPTLAAAFYRRAALAHLEGLPLAVGDVFADLDVGLILAELGYRAVFEPDCRIRAHSGLTTPATGSLKFGLHAERFFWRHAGVHGRVESLVAHPLIVAAEAVADLVRIRRPRWLGRLGGCVSALWDRWRGVSRADISQTHPPAEGRTLASDMELPEDEQTVEPETVSFAEHQHARTRPSQGPLRKAG
jgi:GT2 family glycosyltransferase